MQLEIEWVPLLLFVAALAAYMMIAHLRRPKARRHRGSRSMQSRTARGRARRDVPPSTRGHL